MAFWKPISFEDQVSYLTNRSIGNEVVYDQAYGASNAYSTQIDAGNLAVSINRYTDFAKTYAQFAQYAEGGALPLISVGKGIATGAISDAALGRGVVDGAIVDKNGVPTKLVRNIHLYTGKSIDEVQKVYSDLLDKGADYNLLIRNQISTGDSSVTYEDGHNIFGYTTKLFYGPLNRDMRGEILSSPAGLRIADGLFSSVDKMDSVDNTFPD